MLLVVLVALFALTVIVCGLQYMAMGTLRQTRVALQADDSFYRAEGVVGLLTSRWKKEIRYRQGGPLTSPPSGVEAGQWDGRTYVLGWEREELPTRVPESRATAWIRFPDGRPIRTYRYDLRLRFPRLLDPRAVEITGLSLDSVDPAVESQRKQAFVRPGEAVDSVAAREARVEAHSTVVEQLALSGASPKDVPRELPPGGPDGARAAFKEVLLALDTLNARPPVASRPGEGVTAARSVLSRAQALPDPFQQPWVAAARFRLAGMLVQAAQQETNLATRRASLFEAATELERALGQPGGSCGKLKVAWLLANVIMMQRENPRSREALLNSRNRARSRLRSVTDADRRARIHERTDIRAGELPALLDLLWSGRVASSIRLGERSYVLISVLCTGGSPLMHLESAEPLNPLAWEPDGGTILVAAGVPDTPSIQVWRVAADGSTVKDIPGFRPPPGYDPSTGAAHVYRWRAVPRIDMNPGTGAWCALVLQDFSKVETPGVPLDQLGVTLWGLWRVHPDFPPNYVHNIFCSLIHTIASPLAFSPSGDLAVVAWTASGTTLSLPPDTIGFNLPVIETEPFSAFMGHGLAEETSSALIAPRGTVIGGLSWAKLRSEWIAFALFKPGGKAEVVFQKPVRSGKPPREVVPLPRSPLDLAALDLGSLTTASRAGSLVGGTTPGYLISLKDSLHLVGEPPGHATGTALPRNLLGELGDVREVVPLPTEDRVFFLARVRGASETRLLSLDLKTGDARVFLGEGGLFPTSFPVDAYAVSDVPIVPTDG